MALPGPQLYRSELVGSSVHMLLDIIYAGRVFRFSDSAGLVVPRTSGTAIQYGGGLSFDYESAMELFSGEPDIQSMAFELVFPVDVAALIADGFDLSAAIGELSVLVGSRVYEDRQVLLSGYLSQPEYGAAGEPIRFSIEEAPYLDRAIFPGSMASGLSAQDAALDEVAKVYRTVTETVSRATGISLDTFPTFDPAAATRIYPFVFGSPGIHTDIAGTLGPGSGSPAMLVDTGARTVLIAGHRVRATNVGIYNRTSNGTYNNLAVTSTVDLLGQPISTVTMGAGTVAAGDELYTIWYHAATGTVQEAAYSDDGGNLTGAGDLLAYFLRRSTVRVDYGALAAAKTYLNRFKFSGYIDEFVTPYEWVADNLLPLLPVSMVSGPGGLSPVVWRREATIDDIEETLIEGPLVQRTSAVAYEDESVTNEIIIEYAMRASDRAYRERRVLTPQRDTSDRQQISDAYMRSSALRYGRATTKIDSRILYDNSTVGNILSWMGRARGFRHRAVKYAVDQRYGWLRLGSVIALTDSSLGLSRHVGLIRGIRWAADSLEFSILLIEDPYREPAI